MREPYQPKILSVAKRPGKSTFSCPIMTIEWIDEDGEQRVSTGPGINPEIHSLSRYAEWQGVKA